MEVAFTQIRQRGRHCVTTRYHDFNRWVSEIQSFRGKNLSIVCHQVVTNWARVLEEWVEKFPPNNRGNNRSSWKKGHVNSIVTREAAAASSQSLRWLPTRRRISIIQAHQVPPCADSPIKPFIHFFHIYILLMHGSRFWQVKNLGSNPLD